MHGEITTSIQQSTLNLFGKEPLATNFPQGTRRYISRRCDRDHNDFAAQGAQLSCDPLRLPCCERTLARAETNLHYDIPVIKR